jgi:hypothetical protein
MSIQEGAKFQMTELKTLKKMKKEKSNICKSKGCLAVPMANCNYCDKHWFPANKPEEQLIIPKFLDSLYKHYEEKDEERANDGYIHITSLNLCIREKVFQHLNRKPLRPIQLRWFTNGNAIHHKLQSLVKENPEFEVEKEVKKGNIIAHIDMYNNKLRFPVEAKSLTSGGEEVPKNFHIDQLKMYMALTDDEIGVMLYDPLLNFTDEPFAEWTVKMTKEERQSMLEQIEVKAQIYASAMEQKNPELAPHINYDPEYSWHCEKCAYANECAVMRAREPERQELVNKK